MSVTLQLMIYLRFIVRPVHTADLDQNAGDVAEFMFDEADPRECTRRAVEIMRKEGWRAQSLSDAQEGFAVSDFVGPTDFNSLYDNAVEQGMACNFLSTTYAQVAG